MIKAEELRIGNLVNRNDLVSGDIRTERVLEIRKKKVMISGPIKFVTDFNSIHPIPITEQWLQDLGFVMDDTYRSEIHPFIDWVKDDVRIQDPYREFTYNDGDDLIEIKHVHQLQNLYFTLIGKELTIQKEKV